MARVTSSNVSAVGTFARKNSSGGKVELGVDRRPWTSLQPCSWVAVNQVVRFAKRANKMDFSFAFRRYSLPFGHSVRTSRGPWLRREGLYVRIERPDGSVGFGEAAPLPAFGTETVDEAEACCRSLGDRRWR